MKGFFMTGFKNIPVGLVVFGIILFLLGYFLDATVIKTLWMILSIMIVIIGVMISIFIYSVKKTMTKQMQEMQQCMNMMTKETKEVKDVEQIEDDDL